MKFPASFISCCLVALLLICFRISYSDIGSQKRVLNITQWDALGYYSYLPEIFIYHDLKSWNWAEAMDKKYNVTGGDALPVQHLENGNRVCKYLGGVAMIQAPFFGIAHFIAKATGHPTDGFSPPYQYCLAFGAIVWCMIGLFVLRKVLLRFYSDRVTAVTLLALGLASNLIQYAAVDNGLSHVWIFPLYAMLLAATIRWHERPEKSWAFLIGYLIGLATICRPTEAVALFIPLFWSVHTKEAARAKWALVKNHRLHILFAVAGGISGVLPQLLYWKHVTGTFVYDVGSKWYFLNPWFRVLFGWEKGWFIYTPIAIFIVLGMLFMKNRPFQKSVLVFCGLTIWIVIAWEDWHYGASYSTRALVQSYPVFALPLAALINRIQSRKWQIAFYILTAYLIFVNLFQIVQYNSNLLHYDDMNRRYYSRIYLNAHPDALDMSLLDTDEFISDESKFNRNSVIAMNVSLPLKIPANEAAVLAEASLPKPAMGGESWLRTDLQLSSENLWKSFLNVELKSNDSVLKKSIRLFNPVGQRTGKYAFYMRVPQKFSESHIRVTISSELGFDGEIKTLNVIRLWER